MELTWYGLSCFRITERKQATVVTDPYGNGLGLPELKLRGDVITISHQARGHSNLDAVSGASHVLTGAGEYEIGGVFITAISNYDKESDRRNVLYVFDYNGITVAHLGDIERVPTQKQIEALGLINVLLVPVGAGNSLNATQAAELVSILEPNIVVPMHYQMPNLKIELQEVDRFLKEMGVSDVKEESTLKITSTAFPEETETVILTPKA